MWRAMTGSHQPAQFFRGVVVDEIVNGYQYDPNGDWTNYTYAHDALQSVVGLTGHEGRTIQTTAYAPFGNERAGAGASCSVLKYTGREEDAETGLYYYRARYYDPELIGRFLTEDPLGFEAGINHYVYVNNNPINANDPEGLKAIAINLGVGGVFDPSEDIGTPGAKGAGSIIFAFDTNSFEFSIVRQTEYGFGKSQGTVSLGLFANALFGSEETTLNDLLGPGYAMSGSYTGRGGFGMGGSFFRSRFDAAESLWSPTDIY